MKDKTLHAPNTGISGVDTVPEKNQPTAQSSHQDAASNTPYPLSSEHREMLEKESGISPEAIEARGYFTLPAGNEGRKWLREHGFSKHQQRLGECLIIPCHDRTGEVIDHFARPNTPRTGENGKTIKYEKAAGSRQSLDIAPLTNYLIGNPNALLIVTEGAKKADSAASRELAAINLHGVYGFRGRNELGGIANLPELDEIVWKGKNTLGDIIAREVALAFDSDWLEKDGVYDGLSRSVAALKRRGARVRIANLPAKENGDKMGLDDFFAGGGTVEELKDLLQELPTKPERAKAQKQRTIEKKTRERACPSIITDGRQLTEVVEESYEAMRQANAKNPAFPRLYRGAGGLVTIAKDEEGQSFLEIANAHSLRLIVAEMAIWRSSRGEIYPPRELMEILLASCGKCPLPFVARVMSAPFYRTDGTLCDRPGYDEATLTFLALPDDFVLQDIEPTEENLAAAHGLIVEDILGEVAFADDASRAHAIALMLLPLVRLMIDGATPFHLFEAALQSSGKSYAASIAIALYESPASVNDTKKEEEWDKVLLSAFAAGKALIFIDNIKSTLSAPALASFITEPTKTGRLLGGNIMATVQTRRATWIGSANNASLCPDMVSRTLKIRINPRMAEPADREFKSDAWTYITENRAEVLSALVTMVEAWKAAGKPEFTERKHRFNRWSRVIGGILQVAGIPGFLDNLKSERSHNDTWRVAWSGLVRVWFSAHGEEPITAKQVLELARKECDDFMALLGTKEELQAQNMGKLFSKQRDVVFAVDEVGEFSIERQNQKTNKGVMWKLVFVNPAANANAAPVANSESAAAPTSEQPPANENGWSFADLLRS